MEALEKVSQLLRLGRRRTTQKPLVKVEIKVKMDCDGCERKVKKSVEGMKGVTCIEANRKHHKLTVEGYVEPKEVVERVRKKNGKAAEAWPYVPYKLVSQPFADGAYDKKAPAGYVRDVIDAGRRNLAETDFIEEHLLNVFNDENPNACILM